MEASPVNRIEKTPCIRHEMEVTKPVLRLQALNSRRLQVRIKALHRCYGVVDRGRGVNPIIQRSTEGRGIMPPLDECHTQSKPCTRFVVRPSVRPNPRSLAATRSGGGKSWRS